MKPNPNAPGWVLKSAAEIEARIAEMGREIRNDYQGREFVAICVVKGAVYFFADLTRAIELPMSLGFMQLGSYGDGMASSGKVQIYMDPNQDVAGKNVLLIEDITDTCLSMTEAKRYLLEERGAAEVKVATLLDKPKAHKVPFTPDYIGFSIEPVFVVGYGLDFAQKFRPLRDIWVLPNVGQLEPEEEYRALGASACLVLEKCIGRKDLPGVVTMAEHYGAIVPGNGDGKDKFLVASWGNSPQGLVDAEGLENILSTKG